MSDEEIFSVFSDLSSIQTDPPAVSRSVCQKCRYSYLRLSGMLELSLLNTLLGFWSGPQRGERVGWSNANKWRPCGRTQASTLAKLQISRPNFLVSDNAI